MRRNAPLPSKNGPCLEHQIGCGKFCCVCGHTSGTHRFTVTCRGGYGWDILRRGQAQPVAQGMTEHDAKREARSKNLHALQKDIP